MVWKRIVPLAILPGIMPLALLCAEPTTPLPDGEWIPVPPQSLMVAPGSPLDFSALVPAGTAGDRGPLTVTDGHLRFASGGDDARFNCAMLASDTGQAAQFPDHATADALAVQLRLHGYTLARLHNIDFRLLRHSRSQLDVDPEQLDRFYYLLAALKRNGIYWMVDVLTQPSRDLTGPTWSKGSSPDDLRVRLHFDAGARKVWLGLLDKVFAQPNPYTGKSTLQDPALAFVIGANENDITFAAKPSDPFPTGLGTVFDHWVRARYADPSALSAALPDLSPDERTERAPIAPPSGWNAPGPRERLLRQFTSDLEVDLHDWMAAQLRQRGFAGPVLGYDDWYATLDNRTRAALPVTDVHLYVGEVTSQSPGAQFFLPSATSDKGLGAILVNAGARWLDRPLVATEYSIPYPNPYRYEGGLIVPALAAMQDYSTICRTAFLPVEPAIPPASPTAKPMRGYSAGLDPNERAQETLSALLFYRHDVRPATGTIAVPFGEEQFQQPGSAFLPAQVRDAALLTRFGLIAPDRLSSLPAGTHVAAIGTISSTIRSKLASYLTSMTTGNSQQPLAKLVTALRADGTLPAGNRTDPANGIFQSATGELTIDQPRGLISVVTPATEAASFTDAATDTRIGTLTVESTNAGALVSASALDGMPLARSRRILLILTGDTRNSNMQLSGSALHPALIDWGHLPILMRRVVAHLGLQTGPGRRGVLTTLSLAGAPMAQSSVRSGADGILPLTLDTAGVNGSPTTYFLLELPPKS